MYEAPPPTEPPSRPWVRLFSGCMLLVFLAGGLLSVVAAFDLPRPTALLIMLGVPTVVLGGWLTYLFLRRGGA